MEESSPRTKGIEPLRMTTIEEYVENGNDESVECTFVGRNDKHGISILILPSSPRPSSADLREATIESREETLLVYYPNGDGSYNDGARDEVRAGASKERATSQNGTSVDHGTGKDPKSSSDDLDLSFVISIRRRSILRKISHLREQIKQSLTEDERSAFADSLRIEIHSLERKNLEHEEQLGIRTKTKKEASAPSATKKMTSAQSEVPITDNNDSPNTTANQDSGEEASVEDDGKEPSE
eukprot:jgi/Psemu1/12305/gm1.12305_g